MRIEYIEHYIVLVTVSLVAILGLFFFNSYAPEGGGLYPITGKAYEQVGNFSGGIQTYIACTWSDQALDVGYGTSLSPGDNNVSALNNTAEIDTSTSYNVTNDALSNVAANITIKGEDLLYGSNVIGIGNISWVSNSTEGNGTNMDPVNEINISTDHNYDTANLIATAEAIDSTVWYRFWLDVPSGAVAGTYEGNYTMQCTQAT